MNTIGFAVPTLKGEAPSGNGIKHLFLVSPIMGYETNLSFDNINRELSVGRRTDCDINLPYDTISRLHAKIRIHEGLCYVSDLGSRNKTYVNNRVIDLECKLNSGDTIMFYDSRYQLVVSMKYTCSDN